MIDLLHFFAAIDPSATIPYDQVDAFARKPHPIVSEPSTYGLIFMGIALFTVAAAKYLERSKK